MCSKGIYGNTVVLVGTSHDFQLFDDEIQSFHKTIHELCLLHEVQAIAEEMNQYDMQRRGCIQSIAQNLCYELGLPHQFSDPSCDERKDLGIRYIYDIALDAWINDWTQEKIDAKKLEAIRIGKQSDHLREQEWLRRIQELNVWPLLFICGTNHFDTFSIKLREANISVIEDHKDLKPVNPITK